MDYQRAVQSYIWSHTDTTSSKKPDTGVVEIQKEQLTYDDHVYLFMRTQPPSTDEAGLKILQERKTVGRPETRIRSHAWNS